MSGSASTRAKNKYNANNYDNLRVVVPKGKKDVIKQHTINYGYSSINAFVNEAIQDKMQNDVNKK